MRRPGRKVGVAAGSLPFFFVALAVLYAAACQNNGAAYLLAFFLVALVGVSLAQGFQNLTGLEPRVIGAPNGMAAPLDEGGEGLVEVRIAIHNGAALRRYSLTARIEGYDGEAAFPMLPPGTLREAVVRVQGLARGVYPLRAVEIATVFPFGFARIARRYPIEGAQLWVYPAARPGAERPAVDSEYAGTGGGGSGGEDFAGVRPYRQGESQRHVDWKAVSRGHPMMVKQFGGGTDRAMLLDWERLDGNTEERLGALCHWLLEAEREGFRYGMRLPGAEVPPGGGAEHLHACLRLLAAYPGGGRGRGEP